LEQAGRAAMAQGVVAGRRRLYRSSRERTRLGGEMVVDRFWFAALCPALDLHPTALSARAAEMAVGQELWRGVTAHVTF
jgi:hypothetical protein